jgi:hypothetical protein
LNERNQQLKTENPEAFRENDRTQRPGCRLCPVVGRQGPGLGPAQPLVCSHFSAGLRWGNKENICFLYHWPPALPLGHNCSNPSLRLSA